MSSGQTSVDPLARLVEEHRVFLAETRSFLGRVQRYEALLGSVPLEAAPVAAFARFLREDVEGRHGAKEEQALFPVLVRYVPSEGGPVGVLLREHGELRDQQRLLARAATRLESDAEAEGPQREVLTGAGEVHQLLDLHIRKEETVLFPLAREVLTERDLAEVREAFSRFEAEHGLVHPPASALVPGEGPALPPFCAAGRARRDQATRA